jgi:hypothetical protein
VTESIDNDFRLTSSHADFVLETFAVTSLVPIQIVDAGQGHNLTFSGQLIVG